MKPGTGKDERMYKSDLKLVPVRDDDAGSKYRSAVRMFLESGKTETAVEEAGVQTQAIYVGLRRAVSDMELHDVLAARRRKGQAILERVR